MRPRRTGRQPAGANRVRASHSAIGPSSNVSFRGCGIDSNAAASDEIGDEHIQVEDATTSSRDRPGRPQGAGPGGQSRRGGFYADSDDRARIESLFGTPPKAGRGEATRTFSPAEEHEIRQTEQEESAMPPEYQYLKVGGRAHHPTFGWGKVTRLWQPWPQTRVEVIFDHVGPKKLVLAHAHLTMDE